MFFSPNSRDFHLFVTFKDKGNYSVYIYSQVSVLYKKNNLSMLFEWCFGMFVSTTIMNENRIDVSRVSVCDLHNTIPILEETAAYPKIESSR